jgi:hypothetical protein
MLQDNRSVGEGRVIVLPILLFNACHSGYLECQIDDDVTVTGYRLTHYLWYNYYTETPQFSL